MNASENEFLFTSESVTEGHPDKIADQISDGVLDAVMRDDPHGRVACETLVNTGPSGRVRRDHDLDLRRHPGHRARDDREDRLHRRRVRLRLQDVRGAQHDRQAVARHRPGRRRGVRDALGHERRRRARPRGRGRSGDDVRLREQRDARADAVADRARPPPRASAGGGPQGRNAPLPAPRRQDPGQRALRRRSAGRRSRSC